MLGAQGLWAGRDLCSATPAVTRDLGFSGLIGRTVPFNCLLRHTRGCGGSIRLIDYLRFYVPLKNFSLIWRRHHCRWRATKFRPLLGAQGLGAGRDLYRATPAVTRDLGIRAWTLIIMQYDSCKYIVYTESGRIIFWIRIRLIKLDKTFVIFIRSPELL
jgi:hypothetical protein